MTYDPVVEEVRRVRQQIFAEYNYDLKAMFKDLMRRQAQSQKAGVKFATPPQQKPRPTPKKKAG